ncbi:unnamed protein product [Staurois parvus]|uniref:Uncharacterized protein n=1 Tax=Staurois parvus TaxID=386267 RepID=A0ABN9D1K1_9NEOB|nr:unnamed protein product [Staurois parvus]
MLSLPYPFSLRILTVLHLSPPPSPPTAASLPVRPAGVACPQSSSPLLACLCTALCTLQSGPQSGLSAVCPQSLVIPCTVSAVSCRPLYCVRSLWSSPVLCPQSLVISCTVSAVSGHLLYYVLSLWSSHVLCPQSLAIPCTVRSLLVIPCTVSAVSGHFL